MTTAFTESQVLEACHTLFGPDIASSRAFLHNIRPGGLKAAYRRKAKETHPDGVAGTDPLLQKQQAALFIEVLKAYDLLNAFLKEREGERRTQRVSSRHGSSSSSKTAERGTPTDARYAGPLPQRPLEFGRYIYYRGRIPYSSLIRSLGWQRSQRPVLGDIAVRWGWLNTVGIQRIIGSRHARGRFGEKAMDLGLLSSFQVKTLLFYQRSHQKRLGQYFVEQGLLSREELDRLLDELHEHNSRMLDRHGHHFTVRAQTE